MHDRQAQIQALIRKHREVVDIRAPFLRTVVYRSEVGRVVEEPLQTIETVLLVYLIGVEHDLLIAPVFEIRAGGQVERPAVRTAVFDCRDEELLLRVQRECGFIRAENVRRLQVLPVHRVSRNHRLQPAAPIGQSLEAASGVLFVGVVDWTVEHTPRGRQDVVGGADGLVVPKRGRIVV